MKEQELRALLKGMKVGEPYRFSTLEPDVDFEVERIFLGLEEGWVIHFQGNRMIIKDLEEAVRQIAPRWNFNLKKVIDRQYNELGEMIDLGEF